DQLDLRAVHATVRRSVDEADLHPLLGQVERLGDVARTHRLPIVRDAVGNGRRRDADMIETAEFHGFIPRSNAHPIAPANAITPIRTVKPTWKANIRGVSERKVRCRKSWTPVLIARYEIQSA